MKRPLIQQKTRVGLCAAFEQGLEILEYIIEKGYTLEVVTTSQKDARLNERRIAEIAEARGITVLRNQDVNDARYIEEIRRMALDIMILGWWPAIVRKEAIDSVALGWINLHPSLLPYGRGKHAYYWSIVEHYPFGVSLHFIDEKIDTGKVLFQKEISVKMEDTGESLYRKGVAEVIQLFKDCANRIFSLDFAPAAQNDTLATFRHSSEIETHSEIRLEQTYTAKDLIDIIRARSFSKGDCAYFFHNGKRYHIRSIITEAPLNSTSPIRTCKVKKGGAECLKTK